MTNEHLDRVKSLVKELEAIDPEYPYTYEKALLAFTKIKKLPIFINIVNKGLPVFRTRTHEIKNFFENIREISNPDPSLVKSFARCNKPYQSVFYASENRPTSYLELINTWAKSCKHGEQIYVTVGKWELLEDLKGVLILNPDEKERTSEFEKHHGKELDNRLGKQEPEEKEASIAFLKFISNKFKEIAYDNTQTYIITSAFSNWVLHHANGLADCIIYPSVPFNGKGLNYAIRNDFVKKLELKHVIRNTFEVSGNSEGKFNFSEIEIIESNKIDHSNSKIFYYSVD